ncbi:hypothetical protein BD560DRAFT_154727 [Blakeslea trispora]|nr:hypothetical protein BD560DRAFT_154727 [Blakeslea trispora]
MKFVLSALLVLGLSRLCAADVSSSVELLVHRPDETHDFSYICMDMPDCGNVCVELQPYSPGRKFITRNGCLLITPYSTSESRDVLNYLAYPFVTELDVCHFVGLTLTGDKYVCGEESSITTTTSTSTSTTTTSIPTAIVPTCSNKDTIFGKKKGNGFNGDCCESEADCKDDCIKSKCNGPQRATTKTATMSTKSVATSSSTTTKVPTTTKTTTTKTTTTKTTTTKTTTTKATNTSSVCKSGYLGKKNGKGPKGACCSTQWDCQQECVKNTCS